MTTVECLTAVWGPGAAQLPAPPNPRRPIAGPGQGGPWGSGLPAKAGATGPSLAG